MCFSTPKMPDTQAAPQTMPEQQDALVQSKLAEERRRKASANGYKSTILTSPLGGGKSLLGE